MDSVEFSRKSAETTLVPALAPTGLFLGGQLEEDLQAATLCPRTETPLLLERIYAVVLVTNSNYLLDASHT